jgi:hypothetical protein
VAVTTGKTTADGGQTRWAGCKCPSEAFVELSACRLERCHLCSQTSREELGGAEGPGQGEAAAAESTSAAVGVHSHAVLLSADGEAACAAHADTAGAADFGAPAEPAAQVAGMLALLRARRMLRLAAPARSQQLPPNWRVLAALWQSACAQSARRTCRQSRCVIQHKHAVNQCLCVAANLQHGQCAVCQLDGAACTV